MPADYNSLREDALNNLKSYMDSLGPDKGKKLAYWVNDYVRFLNLENSFQPQKLIRYKRGAIVKAHLGYRIGSEEGGLHYAIVLDRNNSIHNPTVTIIPLTSVKPGANVDNLPRSKVHIGNEVYTLLAANFNAEIRVAKRMLNDIKSNLSSMEPEELTKEKEVAINAQLSETAKQVQYIEKMKNECERMKKGSIALVGQITTISKIRIYDPMYKNDALSKVRVSADTLDLLDARIQELFGAPIRTE